MYLDNYLPEIKGLCKKYKVKSLFVFGSVLTDNFKTDSDIDMLVDLNSTDPIDYAENFFELKFGLEDLLKKPIDLLEHKSLKKFIFNKKHKQ